MSSTSASSTSTILLKSLRYGNHSLRLSIKSRTYLFNVKPVRTHSRRDLQVRNNIMSFDHLFGIAENPFVLTHAFYTLALFSLAES